MTVIRDPKALEAFAHGSFVPTMGSLHEGHLALVRCAARHGRPVVVSVFVNPTQFGPGEDFDRYPRQLEADVEAVREAGADVVFAPDVDTMYPPPPAEPIPVPILPAVGREPGLEDAHRPGHFEGVCQVVARLFDFVKPRWAVFGEKDYQQLLVIRAMAEQGGDRWRDLEIVRHKTVREADGLAMSSRNAYLDAVQREQAVGVSRSLQLAHAAQRPSTAERMMRETLEAHGLTVEYAVIRDALTLRPVGGFDVPTRGLIAVRLGAIRLIDNAAMTVWR